MLPAAPEPPQRHSYRHDIDGLRAVSILLVVAFHAGLAGFAGGFVGVDVFFVLSGYLITGLLLGEHQRTGRISLGAFFARRIRRLLPLAATVVGTTLVLGFWLLPPAQRPGLAGDAVASSLYVANWRFAAQATAYSDFEVTDGLLLHFWSLAVEEQFYVIWPALVVGAGWLVARRRPERFAVALAAVMAVLVTASLWASIAITAERGVGAYYLTHTRLWEMGTGALLAVVVPRLGRIPRPLADVLAAGGLVAIVAAAVRYDATTPFPGSAALVPVLGTAAVIVTAAHGPTVVARALALGPLTALGRLSYAWYLWHWPVIGLALLYNGRQRSPLSPGVVTAVAVVASLAVAAASHVTIENPFRHARRLATTRPSLLAGVALSLVPLALAGVLMQVRDTGDRVVAIPAVEQPAPAVVPAPVGDARSAAPAAGEPPVAAGGPVTDVPSPAVVPAPTDVPSPTDTLAEIAPMTAAEAAADRVDVAPDCNASGVDNTTVDPDCVLGAVDGDVTVALIGDSHAQQWLPALAAVADERGWRLLTWTKGACPPLDVPVWDARGERRYDACETWRQAVVERLAAEPHVDLVVLGRSYAYEQLVIDDGGRLLDTDDPGVPERWSAGSERTFDTLLGVADHVVVLRDTPWAPGDVPSCLSDRPDRPEECAFELAGNAHRDTLVHGAEVRAAAAVVAVAAADRVTFVDLTDAVCTTDPCQVVTSEGVIKYRDRHHLSATFATRLGPVLADRLAAVLRG